MEKKSCPSCCAESCWHTDVAVVMVLLQKKYPKPLSIDLRTHWGIWWCCWPPTSCTMWLKTPRSRNPTKKLAPWMGLQTSCSAHKDLNREKVSACEGKRFFFFLWTLLIWLRDGTYSNLWDWLFCPADEFLTWHLEILLICTRVRATFSASVCIA